MLRGAAVPRKGEFVVLLARATASAPDRGLIGGDPDVAVDATGMEGRHTSRYFARRSGAELASWAKLTTASHFFAGATVSTGPSNDSSQLRPVRAQAALLVAWRRMLADDEPEAVIADKGYDKRASVEVIESRGAEAVIPTQADRSEQRSIDPHLYRERNVCERFWSKAKQFRRVATRYEKKAANFLAFARVAALPVMLT